MFRGHWKKVCKYVLAVGDYSSRITFAFILSGFATVAGECLSTVLPDYGLDKKVALPQLANALRVK